MENEYIPHRRCNNFCFVCDKHNSSDLDIDIPGVYHSDDFSQWLERYRTTRCKKHTQVVEID